MDTEAVGAMGVRARRRLAHEVFRTGFTVMAGAARLGRTFRTARQRVSLRQGIPYAAYAEPAQHLDVVRPKGVDGPLPALVYLHGGGFQAMSKETHLPLAVELAVRGFVVFNVEYRLAPEHPYPAAIEDACAALCWVVDHADEHGADLSRLVLAGESAGANLTLGLTVASLWERPEPWASAVWRTGVVPIAAMPACGVLQASAPEWRFGDEPLPWVLRDLVERVTDAYLPGPLNEPGAAPMADPLVLLEEAEPPERPLPELFALVGTADPLLEDTRRLKTAWERLGGSIEAPEYDGGVHTFHLMRFDPRFDEAWADTDRFLERLGLLRRLAP